MDCSAGDFEKALEHIERALSTNATNENALILKAILLRKSGEDQAAKEILQLLIFYCSL